MSENIAGAPPDKREELEAEAAEKTRIQAEAEAIAAKERMAQKATAQEARRAEEQARQERERAPKAPMPAAPETTANSRAAMDEAVSIREMAEKERDRLQALGNEYDARLRRERERDRLSALRGMGALGSLTDEQLLAITPDVDPHAAGGKAELEEWRERNVGLFIMDTGPQMPSPSELMEGLTNRRSASGLYDEKFFAEMLKQNLGSG